MSLLYISREILLMMGFTFVVGIALAYLIKIITLFFPSTNGQTVFSSLRNTPALWRAWRANVTHEFRAMVYNEDESTRYGNMISVMNELAEYHTGSINKTNKDGVKNSIDKLAEYHTGSI